MNDQTAPPYARRIGALVVAGYLAVVVATLTLSGHRVLPLFEGVGPPPAYEWVHPPPQFAAGNISPQPSATDIPFTAGKTAASVAAAADGQFVVNFSAGAFAPRDSDTALHAAITPLDPATLGAVPPGLAADGNAYRVEFDYRPSKTPATTLAVAGDVVMTAPQPAQALLYSVDGQTWTKLPSQALAGTSTVGATFSRPGWYLVGASHQAVLSLRHKSGLGTAVIAALVAGLAIVLAATPVGLRASRQRRRRTGPPPTTRRRPSRPSKRRR